MRALMAFTNRLGNRASNQDRCLLLERTSRILLAVADGMGGHPGGDVAAQAAVDSLSRSFCGQRGEIDDPRDFLQRALQNAHLHVIRAGSRSHPRLRPRTTAVACLVQRDQAHWAHVGDSRLYWLRNGALLARTRDHSPVEELLRAGLIGEEESGTHPLRSSVNRCLGGAAAVPEVTLGQARLVAGDTLMLCSDGLWAAIPQQKLIEMSRDAELEQLIEGLADEAERAAYPHCDNISVVGLRWLSARLPRSALPPAQQRQPRAPRAAADPLQRAIDDIHRAMLDYASEMKKR